MSALDIITVAELKAHLNKSDSVDDAEMASFVTAASKKVDDMAGPVVIRSVTETRTAGTPLGTYAISLRMTPITSVTSVTENGVVLDPSLYVADLVTGTVTRTTGISNFIYRFLPGTDNLVFVYSAGRTSAVPGTQQMIDAVPDIRLATLELAAHWWRNTQYARQSGRNPRGGDDSELFATHGVGFAIPDRVTEMLTGEIDYSGGIG